jgi:hypothetical protein
MVSTATFIWWIDSIVSVLNIAFKMMWALARIISSDIFASAPGWPAPASAPARARFANHDLRVRLHAPRRVEGRQQLALPTPELSGTRDEALADQVLAHRLVGAELVVVLPMADVDVLHHVGVQREDEPAPTGPHLEHVAVLAP